MSDRPLGSSTSGQAAPRIVLRKSEGMSPISGQASPRIVLRPKKPESAPTLNSPPPRILQGLALKSHKQGLPPCIFCGRRCTRNTTMWTHVDRHLQRRVTPHVPCPDIVCKATGVVLGTRTRSRPMPSTCITSPSDRASWFAPRITETADPRNRQQAPLGSSSSTHLWVEWCLRSEHSFPDVIRPGCDLSPPLPLVVCRTQTSGLTRGSPVYLSPAPLPQPCSLSIHLSHSLLSATMETPCYNFGLP